MKHRCHGWALVIFGAWMFIGLLAGNGLAAEPDTTAFVHATLVPMTGRGTLPDHTVIVSGSKIFAVGPSLKIKIPKYARVINCQNFYLMPGLADMHMHIRDNWQSSLWPVSPLKLYLAWGVTTVRCFGPGGKNGQYVLSWRRQIDRHRLDGPQILTCGPMLRGYFKAPVADIVARQASCGFDFIKLYSYVRLKDFQDIMAAAKALGVYTVGHIPFQVGLDGVLSEKMDEIAHIEELLWEMVAFDRTRCFNTEDQWLGHVVQSAFTQLTPFLNLGPERQVQRIKALADPVVGKLSGGTVAVCTTLVVDDIIVQKLFHPLRFLHQPENRYLPAPYLERFRNKKEKHQVQFRGNRAFARLKYRIDQCLLAGLASTHVPLLLSTDAGTGGMGIVPGFSVHQELAILVRNGLTPYQALAAGTVEASKIVEKMTGQDTFGTIEPGKRADLVVLRANPLADIGNAKKISGVMAAGKWYDQAALHNLLDY